MIALTIDGQRVQVAEGTSVMAAAASVNIDIPGLCYDPNLDVAGACRLCVVAIEGEPKPRTACTTTVREGMVVNTETAEIRKLRRDILQLLLDNHPNDCLTCQKAGECLLQHYAYRYGVVFRDHDGARRGGRMARFTDTSSPYILRDESKCILCGKCVRTCAVVEERSVLTFAGRGFSTHIAADANETLERSTCVSCSRCVVACPVGALIDRRLREKRVRPYAAEKNTVVCSQCEFGCVYETLTRDGETVVRPTSPSGGRPLCLTGRLRVEAEYASDLRKPFIKTTSAKGRVFKAVSWPEALGLETLLSRLSPTAKGD